MKEAFSNLEPARSQLLAYLLSVLSEAICREKVLRMRKSARWIGFNLSAIFSGSRGCDSLDYRVTNSATLTLDQKIPR